MLIWVEVYLAPTGAWGSSSTVSVTDHGPVHRVSTRPDVECGGEMPTPSQWVHRRVDASRGWRGSERPPVQVSLLEYATIHVAAGSRFKVQGWG